MFSIIRFLSGFNIFDGVKLAKLIFYGIIITVGIGTYHKLFIAPTNKTVHKTSISSPGNVTIHQENISRCREIFLGLKIFKAKIGIGYGE